MANIIHVDDDEGFLKLSKVYLEKLNPSFNVTSLSSPLQVLQLLKTDPTIDIIISDCSMTELNGIKLLRAVKESWNIPFIMLTGKRRDDIVIQALSLGADYYLNKNTSSPDVVFRELTHYIKRCLQSNEEKQRYTSTLMQSEGGMSLYNELISVAMVTPRDLVLDLVLDIIMRSFQSQLGLLGVVIGEEYFKVVVSNDFTTETEIKPPPVVIPKDRWFDNPLVRPLAEDKSSYTNSPIIVPEGHQRIQRALSIVIRVENKPIGVLSIANRAFDYTDLDLAIIEQVVTSLGQTMKILVNDSPFSSSKDPPELGNHQENLPPNHKVLLDTFPLPIVATNKEGLIRDANPKFCDLLQIPHSDLIDRKIVNRFLEPLEGLRLLSQATQEGTVEGFEAIITTTNGEKKFVVVSSYFLRGQETEIILSVFTDVTKNKTVEEELTKFAHYFAHDINNNLEIIKGFLNFVTEEQELGVVERIQQQIAQTQLFLRRSLTLAEVGVLAEKNELVNITQLVDELAGFVLPKTTQMRLKNLPTILTDKTKTSQLFLNLLTNAVKHAKPSLIEIQGHQTEHGYLIHVTNDGPPIPDKLRPYLERGDFYNAPSSGFGLKIIGKTASVLGWVIHLLSRPPTTFEIILRV